MPTSKDRSDRLRELRAKLGELTALDPESLARDDELGRKYSFRDNVGAIRQVIDLFKEIGGRDLDRLSTQQLQKILAEVTATLALLDQFRQFDPQTQQPAPREQLQKNLDKRYDEIFEAIVVPLSFTATQQTDYSRLEREAKGVLASMQEKSDALLAEMSRREQASKKALESLEKLVAEGGVAQNAKYFRDDAARHSESAERWLIATVVVLGATVVAAGGFLVAVFYYTPATVPTAIQYTVAKILVLSVLTLGGVWCGRNYRAQKHNQVVNTHRQNALSTFHAFVEGTDDIRVRDAILIAAASSAFGARTTGYDSAQDDGRDASAAGVADALVKTLPSVAVRAASSQQSHGATTP